MNFVSSRVSVVEITLLGWLITDELAADFGHLLAFTARSIVYALLTLMNFPTETNAGWRIEDEISLQMKTRARRPTYPSSIHRHEEHLIIYDYVFQILKSNQS